MSIDKNDVIVKFLGWKVENGIWVNADGFFQQYFDQSLKFHLDWNLLMGVLNVIGNRKDSKMGIVTMFGLGRTRIQCYIKDSLVHDIDIMGISSIDVTYNAIVEYIEWFNKNNSK